jgi:hypothetical protein
MTSFGKDSAIVLIAEDRNMADMDAFVRVYPSLGPITAPWCPA